MQNWSSTPDLQRKDMIPRAITPEFLVLYKSGSDLVGIEIKSAATWNSTFQPLHLHAYKSTDFPPSEKE